MRSRSAHMVFEPRLSYTWAKSGLNLVLDDHSTFSVPDGANWSAVKTKLVSKEELLRQLEAVRALEKTLETKVADRLRKLHHRDLPDRSWKILTGHWLRYLCRSVVRCEGQISELLNSGWNLSASQLPFRHDLVWEHTGSGFQNSWLADYRSHFVFSKVLESMGGVLLSFQPNRPSENLSTVDDFEQPRGRERTNDVRLLKTHRLGLVARSIARIFPTAGITQSTYFPRKTQIEIALKTGLPMVITRPISLPELVSRCNVNERSTIGGEGGGILESRLEVVVWELFWALCPRSFLEGFAEICELIARAGFPKSPRFFLTGNAFDGVNDFVRVYLAIFTAQGMTYIVNQHGNNYFTNALNTPSVEEETADVFLTWGWKREGWVGRYHALGKAPISRGSSKAESACVLFVLDPGPTAGLFPTGAWNSSMYERQFSLLKSLPKEVVGGSTLRFHKNFVPKAEHTKKWAEGLPMLSVEDGLGVMADMVARHALTVFMYDSTGFLEGLQANRPTIMFLPTALDHIEVGAAADYKSLIEQGVIIIDDRAFVSFFFRHGGAIEKWWNHEERQSAITSFSNRFARENKNIATETAAILRSSVV